MKLAASWGAKWGAKFGALEAKQSGQQAGALAGKEAGAEAGAKAGATAAAAAAQRVATKYLSQVLSVVNGEIPGNIFNIYANCSRRGIVPSEREEILREAFCNVQNERLVENVDTKAAESSKRTEVPRPDLEEPTGDYTEVQKELALWKKVLRWVKREEKNARKDSESETRSVDMESSLETTSWKNAEIREREELQKSLLDFKQKEKAKKLKAEEADPASQTQPARWKQEFRSGFTGKFQRLIDKIANKPNSWTESRTIADKQNPSHLNFLASEPAKTGKTGKTSAGTYTEVPSDYVSYGVRPGPGTDPDALARTLTTLTGAAERCK